MYTNTINLKNDWLVLNKCYNFCFYFAITPFHSTSFKKPINIQQKLFIIVLMIVSSCASLYQIWIRKKRANALIKNIGFIFDIVHVILETLIVNVALLSNNFLYKKNWVQLFLKINEEYEVYFNDKLIIKRSLGYFYITFAAPLIFLSLAIILNYPRPNCTVSDCAHNFIMTEINLFYLTLTVMLYLNFLLYFQRRYNCLNLHLEQLIKQREYELKEIKYIRRLFRKMSKSVEKLNEIFGYFSLIYFTHFVIRNIFWIFLVFHPARIIISSSYIVIILFMIHIWVQILQNKSLKLFSLLLLFFR